VAPAPVRDAAVARPIEARPAPAKIAKTKDARRKVEPGILSVQSSPSSWVTIGTQTKETPDKFHLAPGTYLVKFHSDESGVTKYEPITIAAGEMQKLSVPMMR